MGEPEYKYLQSDLSLGDQIKFNNKSYIVGEYYIENLYGDNNEIIITLGITHANIDRCYGYESNYGLWPEYKKYDFKAASRLVDFIIGKCIEKGIPVEYSGIKEHDTSSGKGVTGGSGGPSEQIKIDCVTREDLNKSIEELKLYVDQKRKAHELRFDSIKEKDVVQDWQYIRLNEMLKPGVNPNPYLSGVYPPGMDTCNPSLSPSKKSIMATLQDLVLEKFTKNNSKKVVELKETLDDIDETLWNCIKLLSQFKESAKDLNNNLERYFDDGNTKEVARSIKLIEALIKNYNDPLVQNAIICNNSLESIIKKIHGK